MNADIIEKEGLTARGKRELLSHLAGEKLTVRQMVIAKCYDCMGFYTDGKVDCGMDECSLYPLMPFRVGEKYRSKTSKPMTEEHKAKLRAHLSHIHTPT